MIQMMQPGQLLKHYQIQSILGFGTSGAVYLAFDQEKKRNVAVKVQNFMFRSEAELYEILKIYTFRAVLNIYDCFKQNPDIFASPSVVIMELGNSANLHQYRQQKMLDQVEIDDIFFQIGFGLLELTLLNLIHRDIKPENIVVHVETDGHKYYKICDLGLSKAQDQATTINIGTPFYMAPELFQPDTVKLDYSVDVWALGAIIYELYAKVPLFSGTNIPQVQAKILGTSEQAIAQEIKSKVPNLKHCSILCNIFKKNPNQRPYIGDILNALDANRFVYLQQNYNQNHNQAQQNELIQTLQRVQTESQANSGLTNMPQFVEQNQQMEYNGNNTNNQSLGVQQNFQLQQQKQQQEQEQREQSEREREQREKEQREREREREQREKEQREQSERDKLLEQQQYQQEQQQPQPQQNCTVQNESFIKNQVFLRGSLKDQKLIKRVLEILEKDGEQKAKLFLYTELCKTTNQIKCQDLIDIIHETNN